MNAKSWMKPLMGIIALAALTASCGDDTDVQKQWEAKVVDSEFNEYFTEAFGKIDSEQDFHMVNRRTMNIENIGGDINTTYTIYVCQGNPNFEDDAMALYQTEAQGQSAVTFDFDMPIGLDHLWIVRSAPNDQVASYVKVYRTAKTIYAEMEGDETRAQVSEETINDVTNGTFDFQHVHNGISGHTYTMSAPSTVLQDIYYTQDITTTHEFKATGTYNSVNLYDWTHTSPAKIYVDGNVTINGGTFYYVEFYVPSGSTLTYNGSTTQGGIRFIVKEGGKLIINTDVINAQSEAYPSEIVNEGEVIINGKKATRDVTETSTTTGTVTFPLNNYADMPNAWSAYESASSTLSNFAGAYVTYGSKLTMPESNYSVTGFSENFVGYQPTEKISQSFADNSSHFDNAVELKVNVTGTFQPTKVTANVSRVGTDGGKLDIYIARATWDTPTKLATGLIPKRNNKTVEDDANKDNSNFCGASISCDVPSGLYAGDWYSLYLYIYELGDTKQMAFNNVVIEGTTTVSTTTKEEYGDPSFKMANYCNFYNAGKMTFNCPLEFVPADGNSKYNYFTNFAGATLTGQDVTIGGKGAQFANAGTMDLTGSLDLKTGSGGNAQAVNIGNLSAANLYLQTGVTHFYNGGTTLISGTTESNQYGNTWVNNGYYKTQEMSITAGNNTFYNYCQLFVTDKFYLHDATFNNMSSSYAQAKYLDLGNYTVNLYDNAVLYVTDLLYIAEGKGASLDNGFHGLGSEYAIVAATQMDVRASSSKNIQFLDRVYYSWKNFRYVDGEGNELTEAQANAIAADGDKIIFYADEISRNVSFGELSIAEPKEGECGGVEWNHGGGPTPQGFVYMLAYEDLGTKDDFDFNDIVLRVTHTGGTSEGTVQLVAAGGTLKISIAYDGETLFTHNDVVMYATGGAEGDYTIGQMPGTKTATIAMSDDFTWTDENCLNKFTLNVKNSGGDFEKAISATTAAGYAPQCLVIPSGSWKWPTGRTSIKDAYPQFSGWVADKTANTTWYNYPATGKVYTGQ